jgi:hypothetical protein
MSLGDIDSVEVEILSRHLHSIIDIEPHPYKCILYLPHHECDRMEGSLLSLERYGDIFFFALESCIYEIFFDPESLHFERISDDVSRLIGCLADTPTFFWREILESLEYCSEFARLTEYLIAIVDESSFIS